MVHCKESGLRCHPLKDVEFCSVMLLNDWQILLISLGLFSFSRLRQAYFSFAFLLRMVHVPKVMPF